MTKKWKPLAIVVGGTKGLGLEMAKILARTHAVVVTGRTDPKSEAVQFNHIDLSFPAKASVHFGKLLDAETKPGPKLNTLVYAAGIYENGRLDELGYSHVAEMTAVGLASPILLIQEALKRGGIPKLIAVTSTSQFTPREREPIYCATKAGLAMLIESVSLDPRVGSAMVAAPGGMKTGFWRKSGRDLSTFRDYMDEAAVAQVILDAHAEKTRAGGYRYLELAVPRSATPTAVVRRLEKRTTT